MKIKLISNNNSLELVEVRSDLIELDFEVLEDNSEVELDGRKINLGVFEQLQKRDKRNPQTKKLHRLLIENQMDNIYYSDCVLVLNKYYTTDQLPPEFVFEIITSFLNNKPIFFYFPIWGGDIYYDLISTIGFTYINEDLKKLKQKMEEEKRRNEIIIDKIRDVLHLKEEKLEIITKPRRIELKSN